VGVIHLYLRMRVNTCDELLVGPAC